MELNYILKPEEVDVFLTHQLHGGSGEYILYKLNTNYYNSITLKEQKTDFEHKFILDQTLNIKNNMGSSFLAQGGSSVAFVIKDDSDRQLVFKTAVFKNNIDNSAWKIFIYINIYIRFKEIVGNFLCTLFWYGDNIVKQCKFENYFPISEVKKKELDELAIIKKIG